MKKYQEQLAKFYDMHKRMPGYQEMMALFGYKSKNAVYKLINKLVDHGVLEKDARGRITLTKSMFEIPLLGAVEAGLPTHAEESMLDTLNLDEFMIEKRDTTFLLNVSGNSMIDAGIHSGDLVLVEKTSDARPGDIVIAEVDEEWTMKYLRRDGSKFYLEAANKDFEDIYPEGELRVGGVVKGVLRKYY